MFINWHLNAQITNNRLSITIYLLFIFVFELTNRVAFSMRNEKHLAEEQKVKRQLLNFCVFIGWWHAITDFSERAGTNFGDEGNEDGGGGDGGGAGVIINFSGFLYVSIFVYSIHHAPYSIQSSMTRTMTTIITAHSTIVYYCVFCVWWKCLQTISFY